MQDEPKSSLPQPFTFGGVARFAHAPRGWLLTFQTVVGALAGIAVGCFVEMAWWPVIRGTIAKMPDRGAIRGGTLQWPPETAVRSGTTFLWITVDPANALEAGEGPDLQLDFGKDELQVRSLFGYAAAPYPRGYIMALNRTELEPWWGAWRPVLTVGLGVGVVITLFTVWAALAMIYAWPARLIAFYADRKLSWGGALRLGAACLLPGALFFTLSIVAYTFRQLNLVQLLAAAVLHLMLGWLFLLGTPFCLPRETAAAGVTPVQNPFQPRTPKAKAGNPFQDSGKPAKEEGE